MARRKTKIEAVDWHRNGVGGVGFAVAIVNDPENGRMLVIDFHEPDDRESYGYTAVLNLDKAAEGNIHMYATGDSAGGNAWRGDVLGDQYRPLVRAALDAEHEKMLARIAKSGGVV